MSEIFRYGKVYGGGVLLPTGGAQGQALIKKTNADGDVEWGTVSVETIQVDTIPAASLALLGTVYQYIGSTTSLYTHNFWYECEEISTGNYAWVNVKVQDGGGLCQGYYNETNGKFYEESTYITEITGDEEMIYFTLDTHKLYCFINNAFVETSGGANLPAGGTTGQALVKKSNSDNDVEWATVDGALPTGGTKDQVLTKNSSTDGDASWKDVNALPSGGTTGQSLTKKSNSDGDVEWSDPLSLGETNTTAYAGDKGKSNADHIGNLSNLSTTSKTDLASAVNEVNSKIPQVSSLPTASNDNFGRVYQYVGADADPLISNYFYKCTYDSSTSTYSWKNVKVQPDNTISLELTKVEYDNLSEQEKTDGTIYFVNDWSPEPTTYVVVGDKDVFPISRWLRFDPDNKKGVIIKAGTSIKQSNGKYKSFLTDTKIDLSSFISDPGKDYFLFVEDDGTISCTPDKSTGTGRYFGRFHTLCVNAGTMTMISPASPSSGISVGSNFLVKPYSSERDPDFYAFYNKSVTAVSTGTPYDVITTNHPLSGFSAGDILPESIFCLSWYPDCLFEDAMVYDRGMDCCIDIYLQSGTGLNTRSEYNKTHTVSRQQVVHQNDFIAVGKSLLNDPQFTSAARGSNECTSITGSSDKTTVGGHTDTNGRRMISAIGCEEMCGYLWQWLNEIGPVGGSGWKSVDSRNSFGQEYGNPSYGLRAGGSWAFSSFCGSGSRASGSLLSDVSVRCGARGSSHICKTI